MKGRQYKTVLYREVIDKQIYKQTGGELDSQTRQGLSKEANIPRKKIIQWK